MITDKRIESTLNKFKQALESHPEIRELSYLGLNQNTLTKKKNT